jgi:uncharacterized membrane protein
MSNEPVDPAIAAADAAMQDKVRQVEIAISLVLRIGVIVSVLVILAGLVMMFLHDPRYAALDGGISFHALVGGHAEFPHSLTQLSRALAAGEGRGVVVLGVLLLILTPVLRVAVSVLSFVYEKDPPMVLVTLFVLLVLIASFFLA